MNQIISATILLLLIMDPLGNLPVFISMLKKINPKRRYIILTREMFIALILMLIFLFFGEKFLIFLNLKTEIVSISGGIILSLIAIKMIFPIIEEKISSSTKEEPFIVPLAIPLISGPSLLATLILLSHQYVKHIRYLVLALLIAWSITVCILLLSNFFLQFIGEKGVNALERLIGLILFMLSTQMILDGIKVYLKT
ncbi:YhgN family NAAT transporter [Candidatus Tachikawaea gelatinosa]|nr:YhgN family NAAT transporter [Candidatus Tachikawaea gelatinosa]